MLANVATASSHAVAFGRAGCRECAARTLGGVVSSDGWSSFEDDLWSAGPGPVAVGLAGGDLEGLLIGHHAQLTVWTVLADSPDPVQTLAEAARWPVTVRSGEGQTTMIRVEDGDRSWLLLVLPTVYEGVLHLAGALPHTDDRWQALHRWVGRAAGRIMPVTLNERDFDAIASGLGDVDRVEVSRLAARVLRDGSSYSRGWPQASGNERPSYDEAMAEVDEMAYVRSLSLHVGNRLSVHLRRVAGATFYSGNFALFDKVIVSALASAASDRRDLYRNRDRTRGVAAQTALAIELESPVLADPNAIAELLDEVARPKRLGVAVLHRNPYLHFAVTDYSDGSNFDAFVTDDDRVVIHPGYRASTGALGRFVEIVSEHFATKNITEVQAMAPPTLEDILTGG
jgi:hypothetical protein